MPLKQTIAEFFVKYGINIAGGIIILVAGWIVAQWVGRFAQRMLDRVEIEPPIRTLLVRALRLVLLAFTLVLVLEKFGVPIAPMVTGIGVVGVGIGLATQGVLSNAAAGLVIIFTKPFRVN